MGSISTWRVTLRYPCAGTQGRWTSLLGTIPNNMKLIISVLRPMSMAPRTPTSSESAFTVGLLQSNTLKSHQKT